MRTRLVENVLQTRHTLLSLFKIAESMQNMVIEDEIVTLVQSAIDAFGNVSTFARDNGGFLIS